MGIRNLDRLFYARSIALVGASARPGSLGRAVHENLRNGGFKGAIHLVNPRHNDIDGNPCVASLSDLAQAPDIVIVAAPRAHVLALAEEAANIGAPVAIVITSDPSGHGPNSLKAQLQALAARCVKARFRCCFALSLAKARCL